MVFRAHFFILIVVLGSLATPALGDATSSTSCNDLLGSVLGSALEGAKVDVWRGIRSSKNYKPLSDFILSEDSTIPPIQKSETIGGVGVLRLTTDLRTGSSIVERVDPRTGVSETVFDTQTLPRANAWGRVESVSVSPDLKTLIIGYRNYGDGMAPFEEIRRPLGAQSKLSGISVPTEPLIRNYQSIGSVLHADEGDYDLRNYGLNASTDLVFIGHDGTEKLLDSSFAQDANGRTKILNVLISPNHKYLVIQSIRDGSIDHFQFKIYNRQEGVFGPTIESGAREVNWADGSTLSYRSYSEADHGQIVSVNLDPAAKPLALNPENIGPGIDTPDLAKVVGKIGDNYFYLAKSETGDLGSLRMIENGQIKTLYPGDGSLVIAGTFQRGDYLFLQLKSGGELVRKIFDSKGQEIGNFLIPSCCALISLDWIEPGKTLALKFSSVVPERVDVTYNLATKAFDPPNFVRELMTDDGVPYTSEIVNLKSRDGTVVPMRLSHRRDMIADGTHPTYMEVYGGFGDGNPGFSPAYDAMKYRFMKQGGVLASPALRGGNEFGEKWHVAGMNLNKVKTYEDTAAAAQYLVDHKISNPKKIILTGASNGGLVSAEVGLSYPDLFGLVIPENGPYDIANTEILDARSQGAKQEYGSNSVPAEKQNKIDFSPLEKAKNPPANAPAFFIVNGNEDSRVNPVHSTEFFETLKQNSAHPETVQMLKTPFSGHGNYSTYDGIIGWSTESAIWTKIYDFLGWQFKK
jgi:dienelactone hydrolase